MLHAQLHKSLELECVDVGNASEYQYKQNAGSHVEASICACVHGECGTAISKFCFDPCHTRLALYICSAEYKFTMKIQTKSK